jgi:hypothetical protein
MLNWDLELNPGEPGAPIDHQHIGEVFSALVTALRCGIRYVGGQRLIVRLKRFHALERFIPHDVAVSHVVNQDKSISPFWTQGGNFMWLHTAFVVLSHGKRTRPLFELALVYEQRRAGSAPQLKASTTFATAAMRPSQRPMI